MVFVSGVVKGYIFTVVIINTRGSNNRSSEVVADVFDGDIGCAKIGFSTHVETICVFGVHFIFYFTKSWTDTSGKALKKNFSEGITKKGVVKVFDRTLGSEVASTAFGDKCMDMRILF